MAEVLVVDDDGDIRTMLRITLEDAGFVVREAGDGYAALAALEEHAPDCMVLDLMMPKLDGFGVLKSIRQRDLAPRTKVMILTCKVEERDFARGWELGADEYMTKPFEPERLARKLDELLHTVARPAAQEAGGRAPEGRAARPARGRLQPPPARPLLSRPRPGAAAARRGPARASAEIAVRRQSALLLALSTREC